MWWSSVAEMMRDRSERSEDTKAAGVQVRSVFSNHTIASHNSECEEASAQKEIHSRQLIGRHSLCVLG